MVLDTLLAVFHHICVFGIFVILASEMVLVRPGMTADTVKRVARMDAAYGILAGLTLVAGALRVFYGAKGIAFYTHNPIFWIKLGVFIAIGLLSIVPTVSFIRWRRALRVNPTALPEPAAIDTARKLILTQHALLFLLPILAAMMARGIGYTK